MPGDDEAGRAGAYDHPGTDSYAYLFAWDHRDAALARRGRRSGRGFLLSLAQTAALAALIFLGAHAVVQGYAVEGPSMQPSYHSGQRVFVNKALYTRLTWLDRALPFVNLAGPDGFVFHGPRRGEVIVFDPPFASRNDLIKRVVGVPGDRVDVFNGRVFVNGSPLSEPYVSPGQTLCGGPWCSVTLGPNEYYVLGDNRASSHDSRHFGPVTLDHIVGKAWLVAYPLSDFGVAP